VLAVDYYHLIAECIAGTVLSARAEFPINAHPFLGGRVVRII